MVLDIEAACEEGRTFATDPADCDCKCEEESNKPCFTHNEFVFSCYF